MGYLRVFEMGGKELVEREGLSIQEKMMILCKVEGKVITAVGEGREPHLPL